MTNTTPDENAEHSAPDVLPTETPAEVTPEVLTEAAAVPATEAAAEIVEPVAPAAQPATVEASVAQPTTPESSAAQPTTPIAPAAPVASAPIEPVAPVAPAATTPVEPVTPAAPSTPAAPAHQPHAHAAQPTGAFGQPVAPNATVYAPNAAPQPYAQQSHGQHAQQGHGQHAQHTQPTEPYLSVPGSPADASASTSKRRGTLPIVAALVAGALIGGVSSAGVAAVISSQNDTNQATNAVEPQNVVVNNTDSVNEITAVAAKASPSVVTISVQGEEGAGTGSGVVISKDGYVLTNTHVVTLDGSASDVDIQVETSDGKLYAAELIGTDPTSDLAVIKLTDAKGLTPLEFADSTKLNVGDAAIAIGAPLGLTGTVTNGIVSALNRSIQVASSAAPEDVEQEAPEAPDQGGNGQNGPFDFWNFDVPGQEQPQPQASSVISIPVVQTDAAINPGNSGGALLNSKGQIIGINVAIASAGESQGQSGSIGVGFAIQSNLAKRVANEIIENGKATHGLLGASVGDAASAEAGIVGALVKEVPADGAASKAGIEKGDIITTFNGVPISNATDLTAQVRALPAGAKTELSYTRDGESSTVSVTLGTYAP